MHAERKRRFLEFETEQHTAYHKQDELLLVVQADAVIHPYTVGSKMLMNTYLAKIQMTCIRTGAVMIHITQTSSARPGKMNENRSYNDVARYSAT